jgi:antitoxin VapB
MSRPQTAKLFKNGRSQAVRLPAAYQFQGKEVFITREGGKVILTAKSTSWDDFFAATTGVPDNFMIARRDAPPQKRKRLK